MELFRKKCSCGNGLIYLARGDHDYLMGEAEVIHSVKNGIQGPVVIVDPGMSHNGCSFCTLTGFAYAIQHGLRIESGTGHFMYLTVREDTVRIFYRDGLGISEYRLCGCGVREAVRSGLLVKRPGIGPGCRLRIGRREFHPRHIVHPKLRFFPDEDICGALGCREPVDDTFNSLLTDAVRYGETVVYGPRNVLRLREGYAVMRDEWGWEIKREKVDRDMIGDQPVEFLRAAGL